MKYIRISEKVKNITYGFVIGEIVFITMLFYAKNYNVTFFKITEFLDKSIIPWLTALAYISAFIAIIISIYTYNKKERREEILLINPMSKILSYLHDEPTNRNKNLASFPKKTNFHGILSSIDPVCQFVKNVLNVQDAESFRMFCRLSNIKLTIDQNFDDFKYVKNLLEQHKVHSVQINNDRFVAISKDEVFVSEKSLEYIEDDFKCLKKIL